MFDHLRCNLFFCLLQPLRKQNSIGSAAVTAGAHKGGASSSSPLPELQQLPSSLKQSSKEAKVWSKENLPDCSKDPENLPVVVRGKPADLKDNAALEDEDDEDEVFLFTPFCTPCSQSCRALHPFWQTAQ